MQGEIPSGRVIGTSIRYDAATSEYSPLKITFIGPSQSGIKLGNDAHDGKSINIYPDRNRRLQINRGTGSIQNATIIHHGDNPYFPYSFFRTITKATNPFTLVLIQTGNDNLSVYNNSEDGVVIGLDGLPLLLAYGRRGNLHGSAIEAIVRLKLDTPDAVAIGVQGEPDDPTVLVYRTIGENEPTVNGNPGEVKWQTFGLEDFFLWREGDYEPGQSLQQKIDTVFDRLETARRELRSGTISVNRYKQINR